MTRARLINARPSLPGKSNAIAGHTMRCRPFARPARAAAYSPGTSSDASASRSITSSLHFREACSFLIESVEHFARIARTHASFHTRRSPAVAHAAHGRSLAPTSTLAGTPRRHRAARARSQRATPDTGSPASGCAPPPHRLARRGQDTGRAMWRIDPNCARRGPASRYPIRR